MVTSIPILRSVKCLGEITIYDRILGGQNKLLTPLTSEDNYWCSNGACYYYSQLRHNRVHTLSDIIIIIKEAQGRSQNPPPL